MVVLLLLDGGNALELLLVGYTGNVVGNVMVIVGQLLQVIGASQSNITSLGTLTALTVDDIAMDGKVMTMTEQQMIQLYSQ